MDGPNASRSDLAGKIARLVEERGWNQEDFARIANLNRHTVREIIKNGSDRRLRNATVSQCAAALGLHVNELRDLPLDKLLPRMHGKKLPEDEGGLKLLTEKSTTKELLEWLERNAERAAQLTPDEATELLGMDGPNGALLQVGVEHCVERVERKRRLMRRVAAVASTDHIDLLEQMVSLLFDKIQTPRA
ncbi:MAG TPA: helix-turn-helix transcriptional regulator [Gemmataceae bacterium]|jgi:transcriptional regulator with XRE-family HTH domain|nr:helix-turn-helix transcriptional regulator [Gemmataceae bacterium]